MLFVIKEKKVLDDWEDLLIEYLKVIRGIKENEMLESVVNQLRTNLEEKKRFVFCAYLDNTPCGFITGSPQGEIMEAVALYVLPKSYDQNTAFELVKTLTTKAFELNLKHFRLEIGLPFNKEPTFEKNLEINNYFIFPRTQMYLDIKDVLDYSFTLPNGYSFVPFTNEKVDEIMHVIVEANPSGHPDSHIYPEMRSAETVKQLFGRATENFMKLDPSINPQIVFDGNIIGISQVITVRKDVVYIGEMCVHPDHQGKGLGKALMKNIILECSRKDIKKIALVVTSSNDKAFNLYVRNGFKITSNHLAVIKHK